jgi:hypothetical protein
VYWLAGELIRIEKRIFPAESLRTYPSHCASVLMCVEKSCSPPFPFCSVIICASGVIWLTEKAYFCLKLFMKMVYQPLFARWSDHCDSVPPTSKAVQNLHQLFEERDTVTDSPRTGRHRTARSENNALICQALTRSLGKSTLWLTPEHLDRHFNGYYMKPNTTLYSEINSWVARSRSWPQASILWTDIKWNGRISWSVS